MSLLPLKKDFPLSLIAVIGIFTIGLSIGFLIGQYTISIPKPEKTLEPVYEGVIRFISEGEGYGGHYFEYEILSNYTSKPTLYERDTNIDESRYSIGERITFQLEPYLVEYNPDVYKNGGLRLINIQRIK